MSGAGHDDELRALQARAYGRDAALTADEAARLRELEDERLRSHAETADTRETADATAVSGNGASSSGADDRARAVSGEVEQRVVADDPLARTDEHGSAGPDGHESHETTDGVEPPHRGASLRAALRTHTVAVVLAAVVVLLLGVGVGWLAFGRVSATAVALTAGQQEWQNTLIASGKFDAGSVRPLAVEEDAVVWTATKNERKQTCLVFGNGEQTVPTCGLTESVAENGLYGSLILDGEDGNRRELNGQLLLTASGEPALALNVYDYGPDGSGMVYANEEEAATARRLVDDGFDANSIWVLGYDEGVPIWMASQTESGRQCLIYDGSTESAPLSCAEPEMMQDQQSGIVLVVRDSETGAATQYEMSSSSGPGVLVITREGSVTGAAGE